MNQGEGDMETIFSNSHFDHLEGFEGRAKKGGSLVGEIYGRFLDLAESSL